MGWPACGTKDVSSQSAVLEEKTRAAKAAILPIPCRAVELSVYCCRSGQYEDAEPRTPRRKPTRDLVGSKTRNVSCANKSSPPDAGGGGSRVDHVLVDQ
jgi:hypothetical protein